MQRSILSVLVLFIGLSLNAQPLERLINEHFPEHTDQFIFELKDQVSETGKDFFEISNSKGKIKISGNTNVSIASGLNWYLKYYCNCSFSACGNQLKLPKKLPQVKSVVRIETDLTLNSYMNYCTFGYTTTFWNWERWKKEIDFMALEGINIPLAVVGLEVVWKNVLQQFGYDNEEVKEFFTAPTHLPWLWMGNMENMGGPLPDEWFVQQEELQKKIVARMREWGMEPIFQAFFGMVPYTLGEKYPESIINIIEQGKWVGIDNRPPVLLPADPLFKEMATAWYKEYEKLFGKAKYYGGDLFHEGGRTRGVDITEVARGVQKEMMTYNPEAVWVLQSWQSNPKRELLEGLNKENTLVIDLATEFWQNWKKRDGFWGYSFLCGHVTNYGANIGLHGRLDAIAESSILARKDSIGKKSVKGVAAVPEGIELNPVTYELANEMRWRSETPDMEKWVEDYSVRRYGLKSDQLKEAWSIFYNTAYGTYEGHRRPSESVFCGKPSLKGLKIVSSPWGQCRVFYDTDKFAEGVGLLLSESSKLKDAPTYEYDAVDFTRQYLTDLGREAYYGFVEAYNAGDKEEFEKLTAKFLELLMDQDRLLSSYYPFFVGKWIDEARAKSTDVSNQDYYEYCARLQITTWTDTKTSLADYGSKEWGGVLKDVYGARWAKYIDVLGQRLDGKMVDDIDFYADDKKWAESRNHYVLSTEVKPIDLAIQLYHKYKK